LKALEVKRRYQQSAKGRATARRREGRADVKAKRREFSASQRGRLNNEKYRRTSKGRAVGQKRSANYRARLASAEGTVTAQDWIDILERHRHRCYYCKKKTIRMTLDHVIPLSKGGRNSPENVVPACQSCNCAKRDKMILLC
jgi:5-methylcytosine-specific restriction endonuclease McrA